MRHRRWLAVIVLGTGALLSVLQHQSRVTACAPAPREGESVSISGEAALIVWDPKTSTEHFVRRADFETKARDFGFLVPTPSPPDLGEVDDAIFDAADQLTRARVVHKTKVVTAFGFGEIPVVLPTASAPAGLAAPSGEVEVLHHTMVGELEATVVRADDPKALTEWLERHGYESRPALTEWLKWYTDHGWIITAFKLAKDRPESGRLQSKSVRMSFHADRPFYPYREPADLRQSAGKARSLRVFFLADQKYEGTLGDAGAWPGSTVWANDIGTAARSLTGPLNLNESNGAKSLGGARYLTEFEDDSNPRPGTDEVYFRPAADQSTRERPPIIITDVEVVFIPGRWGSIGGMVLIVMIAVGVVALRFRQGAGKTRPKADPLS